MSDDQRTRLIPRRPPGPPPRPVPPLPSNGPPWPLLGVALVVIAAVFGFRGWYITANTDLLGLKAPDLGSLTLDGDGVITDGTRQWQVAWEDAPGVYEGTVRWAVPWRDADWPFFSHDVLLVTGELAGSERVTHTVSRHVVFTKWSGPKPTGTLAMVHAVTLDVAMYAQLMTVRPDQYVRATGREISRITRLGDGGTPLDARMDMGCKTMLMTRLEIVDGR